MNSSAVQSEPVDWGDVTTTFGEIAQVIISSGPSLTPDRLVLAAHRGVPHVDAAGLTLMPSRGQPRSLAVTGGLARRADEIQHAVRQGPCLDAAQGDDLVRVDDLVADQRWPIFGPAVVSELGIRSILSVRLQLESDHRAALNFYALLPRVLTEEDLVIGAIFASFVSLSLEAEQTRRQVAELEAALQTSRQIGTAIGILMARGLLTSDQAFNQLRDASQALNRKLRDIALDVVETGELPTVPPPKRAR